MLGKRKLETQEDQKYKVMYKVKRRIMAEGSKQVMIKRRKIALEKLNSAIPSSVVTPANNNSQHIDTMKPSSSSSSSSTTPSMQRNQMYAETIDTHQPPGVITTTPIPSIETLLTPIDSEMQKTIGKVFHANNVNTSKQSLPFLSVIEQNQIKRSAPSVCQQSTAFPS